MFFDYTMFLKSVKELQTDREEASDLKRLAPKRKILLSERISLIPSFFDVMVIE